MEYDNHILIQDNIVKAISFNGIIYGTTVALSDAAALFGRISLKKINSKINTGSQGTHGICLREDFVQLKKSSNVSDTEIIHQAKL